MSRRDDAPERPSVTDSDQPLFARWSQRKLAQREGTQPMTLSNTLAGGLPDGPVEDPTEQDALSDSDMPPLTQLDAHSDYSMFFSPKVSEELRGLALRKLFHCAQFNVCDDLDDYAEDFTSFAALGDVLTADIRQRLQVQADKTRSKATADPIPTDPDVEEAPHAAATDNFKASAPAGPGDACIASADKTDASDEEPAS